MPVRNNRMAGHQAGVCVFVCVYVCICLVCQVAHPFLGSCPQLLILQYFHYFSYIFCHFFRASISSCVKYSSYSRWLIVSFVIFHSLNMCFVFFPLDTSGTFYSCIYLQNLISQAAFLSLPLLYCYIVFLSSGIQLFFGVFLLPLFLANV